MNGAGAVSVVPDDVQGFGRAAYRIAEELRSASASLDTEVQGLTSTWKGAAADSYVAGWDEMHRGALDVWDTLFALADIVGYVMSTAEDGFSVDLEHLDAVTARMRGLKGYVADQLAALDSAANAAMLNWSGEAATAYQVAHREWADGATDIQDGLTAMESAAQIAHANYSGAMTKNLKRLGL